MFVRLSSILLPGFLCRTLSGGQGMARPVVMCGPSGAGKSTLIKKLMNEFQDCFAFSISHTTRQPRSGEVDGKDYYFVTREEMLKAIENDEFVEHAEFSKNLYGTSKKSIKDVGSFGQICVLDIDMQGVKSIKKTDLDPIYIFVKTPDNESLKSRLVGRGTETEESVSQRLEIAKGELRSADEPGLFDHILVNNDLDIAYEELKSILMKYFEAVLKSKREKQ